MILEVLIKKTLEQFKYVFIKSFLVLLKTYRE